MIRIIILTAVLLLFFTDGQLAMHREQLSTCVLSITLFGLLSVFALRALRQGRLLLRINWPIILLFSAFFVLVAVSFIAGPWYDTLFDLMRYGSLLLILFLVIQIPKHELPLSYLQDCFLLILGLAGLLILAANLFEFNWGYADLDISEGLGFTIGNRNHFGAACLIALFVGLPRIFTVQSNGSRLLVGLAILSGYGICLFSGSRGVLLQLFLGTCLLLFFLLLATGAWKRPKWIFVSIITTFVVFALAFELFVPEYVVYKLIHLGQNSSDSTRLSVWQVVIDMILDKPLGALFGHGAGYLYHHSFTYPTEGLHHHLRLDRLAQAHNEYLDIILESGAVGFCLIVAGLAIASWPIIGGLYRKRGAFTVISEFGRFGAQGLVIGLLTAALFALFSVAYRYTVALLPLTLVLGLVIRDSQKSSFFSPIKSSAILVSALIFSLCGLAYFIQQFRADYDYMKYVQYSNLWLKVQGGEKEELFPVESTLLERETSLQPLGSTLNILKERAAFYMDRGLEINPSHVRLRFKYYERASADQINFSKEDVIRAFEATDSLLPNMGGLWSNHAEYLASINELEGAVNLARKEADRDYYNLSKELDVLFYQTLSNNIVGMKVSAANVLKKSALAEIQKNNPVIIRVDQTQEIVSITYQETSRADESIMDLETNLFLQQIFDTPIPTKLALKQRVVSMLLEIYGGYFGIESPVFLENFRILRNPELTGT